MTVGPLMAGSVLGLTNIGLGLVSAHNQKKAAQRAADKQEEIQKKEKAAELAKRRSQIDALRDSAVGMTAGRRSLLSGAETGLTDTGMTSGYGTKKVLG